MNEILEILGESIDFGGLLLGLGGILLVIISITVRKRSQKKSKLLSRPKNRDWL